MRISTYRTHSFLLLSRKRMNVFFTIFSRFRVNEVNCKLHINKSVYAFQIYCNETQFLQCSSVCMRVRIPFDCTLFCTINHSLTKTISKRMEKKEKKNRENFSNTSLDNIYTLYTRIHYTILSILLLAIRAALLVHASYVVLILHFS